MGLFKDIFFKEKRDVSGGIVNEPISSATSVMFSGYRLDQSASTLSAFFAARELISNSVAQLPIKVRRNNDVVEGHLVNVLFRSCLMNKFNLLKKIVEDMIDYGNALVYIQRGADGKPVNLVYVEHSGYSIHYQYNTQELYYRIPFLAKGNVKPDDVLHFYKNSYNAVEGKSLLVYANNILDIAKATDRAAKNYYNSGCAVQGVLTIKGTRKNSKEQARQAFQETHSGLNASGLVILDDDMSYQPISGNANESQLLETRLYNVGEVARYFNISPVLLGDLSKSSYNTIEAANIEFVTHTLSPYIAIIEEELNRKFFKTNNKYKIDLDETYLIRGDKASTASYLTTLVSSGICSINEARSILNLPEKEGLDDVIIPYTNIQDNKVNSENQEEENGNQDNNSDDNDLDDDKSSTDNKN